MRPYDIEAIVIGTVLRYGLDSARTVLPQLTSDKFVFDVNGEFGMDHAVIWDAITDTFSDNRAPNLIEVSQHFGSEYFTELRSLVDRLEHQYKIYEYDAETFQRLAQQVDKAGVVYGMATSSAELSKTIEDTDIFAKTVSEIEDIDRWTSEQLGRFSSVHNMKTGGYESSAEIVTRLKDRWQKLYSGEETILPNCGLPILLKNALFPKGKLAVIHGMSGTGKSSFVFQVLLGTAIDLYLNNKQGCVAINSLEMEQDDLIERMCAILARVDVSKFMKGTIAPEEMARLDEWSGFVSALPIYVDGTNFITTSAMQYRSQGLHVSEHGPVVQLASDYTELFADEDNSEEQRVARIVRQHFHLARMLNASVLVISQSTVDKEVSKKTFIAGPDGTRYSKAIKHATDIQVEMWNPVSLRRQGHTIVVPDRAEYCLDYPHLFIQKYRGAAEGAEIPLGWIPESTTFYDQDVNFGMNSGKEVIFTHLQDAWAKYKGQENAW